MDHVPQRARRAAEFDESYLATRRRLLGSLRVGQ